MTIQTHRPAGHESGKLTATENRETHALAVYVASGMLATVCLAGIDNGVNGLAVAWMTAYAAAASFGLATRNNRRNRYVLYGLGGISTALSLTYAVRQVAGVL